MCRNEREQQKKEEHRGGLVCNLCEEKFKNKSELKEHWETDHEGPVYECIHLECENRYLCQEMWRDHMKKKHRIGFYCEQCDEYCLFEEELEEHMDSHATEIECEEDLEEHTEIECVQCKEKFESEDEITKHEDDGQECNQCEGWLCHGLNMKKHKKEEQCDQCGEYLCYGMSIERHKKKKHGTTSEEGSKEEENKKDSNEDKEKDEVGIMVCDLSNQPDRPADWSSQINKSRLKSAEELEEINKKKDKREPTFTGPLQVWPMVYI